MDQARSAYGYVHGDVHDKGPQTFRQRKGESDLKNAPTFRGIMKWDPFLWGHCDKMIGSYIYILEGFRLNSALFLGLVIYIMTQHLGNFEVDGIF